MFLLRAMVILAVLVACRPGPEINAAASSSNQPPLSSQRVVPQIDAIGRLTATNSAGRTGADYIRGALAPFEKRFEEHAVAMDPTKPIQSVRWHRSMRAPLDPASRAPGGVPSREGRVASRRGVMVRPSWPKSGQTGTRMPPPRGRAPVPPGRVAQRSRGACARRPGPTSQKGCGDFLLARDLEETCVWVARGTS
jgi:hypothetical protein